MAVVDDDDSTGEAEAAAAAKQDPEACANDAAEEDVPAAAAAAACTVAASLGASLEVQKGSATIRLAYREGANLAADLKAAVAEVVKRTAEISAVFLLAAGPGSAADATEGSAAAGPEGALVDGLGQLPHLLVGLIGRAVSCTEACLFAACDVVLAATGASVSLARGAPGSAPAVPLALLRSLDAAALARRLPADGAPVDAETALALGLVHEVLDPAALRDRHSALRAQLAADPAAAVAALRWVARRRRGERGPSPAAAAARKRSRAGDWLASLSARPAKRARAADAASDDEEDGELGAVAAALAGSAAGLGAAAVRRLLRRVVSVSLGLSEDCQQAQLAGAVGEALAELEAHLQAAATAEQAELACADTERVARDAAAVAAEAEVLQLRGAVARAKDQLAESTAALREAAAVLKEARIAQEEGNAQLNTATAEKERLEDAQGNVYAPLQAGTVTGAKAKKQAAALVALGKTCGFDPTLLEGLPSALVLKPAARTMFDNMVLQAFEAQLGTRLAECETLLVQGAPGREARAAATEQYQRAHDEAKERQRRCVEELNTSTEAVKVAEAKLAAARATSDAFGPALREVHAQRAVAREALDWFTSGPLATFRRLREAGGGAGGDESAAESMHAGVRGGLTSACIFGQT